MTPTVSVVIPNWNGLSLLKQNLARKLELEGVTEWILVDDASNDGSVEWIKENYPQIKIIEQPVNQGFVRAVNIGASHAKGNLLAILNHDLLPHKDAITKSISHFKDQSVAGVTFRETGESGWGIINWKSGWPELSAGPKIYEDPHETFWGSGGETIYRKSIWKELGGYDEIFSPGYWEDVDFGYRARKRGWKLIWEPKAIVESAIRGESFKKHWEENKLVRIKERNRLLFVWKNITSTKMIDEHKIAILKRMALHPGYAKPIIQALSKIIRVIKLRDIERKEAKLTDEEVFERFRGS